MGFQLEKVAFADTRAFSPMFMDYVTGVEKLKSFYNHPPRLESFAEQLREKSFFPVAHRELLVEVLQRQYADLKTTDVVTDNVRSLRSEKTFTVTTGHQLNLFTGPLYFIYKIVTVINTCAALRARYPEYSFVPVYWMASEDHDFAEISFFRLYGKKYQWQTDQTGAVGRFNTKTLSALLSEIPGDIKIFKDAYLQHNTLAAAVRYYVNALFAESGVVVIDADEASLKNLFSSQIEDDLINHTARRLVDNQNSKLEGLGYRPQVHARDINLFYLDGSLRSRFEADGTDIRVVDQSIRFTQTQALDLLRREPAKFSPNVILRPLYQEVILPNLAYIGGPAELAYWLQLKSLFDFFKVPFPILLPRNFALVMNPQNSLKFGKTGLETKDLFEDKNFLFNHWVLTHAGRDLSLGDAIQTIHKIFESIRSRAAAIDATLGPLAGAEQKRTIDRLERIEKKMLGAEKRRHSEKLRQIEAVKDELFPGGSWQERTDNFLNFYQQNDRFVWELIGAFDPFDFRFNVLMYNE